MVIAHNLAAVNAQRQYGMVTTRKAKTMEKLSSGYRINRAADDAAGLTISEKMRLQIRGLNQGSNNIQDGISLVQIADGALAEVNDMLHRMTELSIKSANGTNTEEDRNAIQKEIGQIIQEIDRIKDSTEYNTMPIFDDMFGAYPEGSVTTLVSSPAADAGYLSEAVLLEDSLYHPCSTIDFSKVNSHNISKLNNAEFTFHCSASCKEAFNIKFIANGDGTQDSATDLSGEKMHKYNIDISNCSNGTDIVNKIYDYVNNNLPNGAVANAGLGGGSLVSHSNVLIKDGSSLLIVATNGYSSEAAAKRAFPNSYTYRAPYYSGVVECSDLAGITDNDKLNTVSIQCSSNPEDYLEFDIPWMNAKILGIKGIDVSTEGGAKRSIEVINKASAMVSSMRSDLGATQNRLEHAYDNNNNKAENTTAAESRIRDANMADEMVRLSKDNILAQVGEAMMSQANQSKQGVLSLLQ